MVNESVSTPPDGLKWVSYSGDTCIEVARHGGTIYVRNPGTGPDCVSATRQEWERFLAGVRAGRFNTTKL